MNKVQSTNGENNNKVLMSHDEKKAAKALLKENIISIEQKTNSESKIKKQ
jgi:hypothetical protein